MPWGLLLNKWLWIGLLIAGLAAFGQYERWQANRYQAIAEAERERVKALGVQIEEQNKAVDALKKVQDEKVKKAEDGLRAVKERVRALAGEAARLGAQAAAAKPTARPDGCPASGADKAVQTVREGLR